MTEAIFFDIDGTLLSTQTHTIPQSALRAIDMLHDKGIKVFIATGRSWCEMQSLPLHLFDGYITMSGQYCCDTNNNVIFEKTISSHDITTIVNYATTHDVPANFTDGQEKYYNMMTQPVLDFLAEVNIDSGYIKDISYAITNKVHQVSVYVDDQEELQLLKLLPNCSSARWHPAFCDIFPLGGDKLNGIKQMCRHYNIDIANTMAFGDGGNDVPMLVGAGISVAMGNGTAEAKASAQYITDSVDDNGVYNALVHFGVL